MANSICKVEVIAHVGSIDIREFSTGKTVVNMSLPVKNNYKKPDGEWSEETEWVKCVFSMPALVERIKEGVSKGDYIRVEGSLRTKKYTNKDGIEVESREVTCYQYNMLQRASSTKEGQAAIAKTKSKPAPAPTIQDDLEDLPF